MFGKSLGVVAVPSQDDILALFGMKPTGKAPTLARPKLKFAKPKFVPTGSISAPNRSMGQAIQDKTGSTLRAVGLNNYDASRWAGKLFGALNDLTPLGNATGADEGARMVEQGVTKGDLATGLLGGAAFLASVLPYGNKVSKPLKSLMRDETGAIRAWHGSPHDFDKFEWSPRTRGTGEGAQAYGDGLYFAENRQVAEDYRDTLSRGASVSIDGQDLRNDQAKAALTAKLKPISPHLAATLASDAIEMVSRHGKLGPANFVNLYKPLHDAGKLGGPEAWAAVQEAARLTTRTKPFDAGRLYEVNINAEPEDFLDWDAPAIQQPSKPYSFLIQREGSPDALLGRNGMNYVKSGQYGGVASAIDTEEWLKAGIPGIRFLDQGSRGAGQGTSNYVVFDDSLIDILNKY